MFELRNLLRRGNAGTLPLVPPLSFNLAPRGPGAAMPLSPEQAAQLSQLELSKLGLRVYFVAPPPDLPDPGSADTPTDEHQERDADDLDF